MHGWIILDKPLGLSSAGGVAAVKRILREGGYPKTKIGHGGTLDPLATGVLPIALGEATKLAGRMLDATKAYEFTIVFGIETDTLDREGAIVVRSDRSVDDADVEDVLADFIGPITQVPPVYSALKVGGTRAYDLARAGSAVTLASRNVTIHELDYRLGWREDGRLHVTLAATVSKGTYIRSLARDIARAVGSVGHVAMLRRTKAGPFGIGDAVSLDKLAELLQAGDEQAILPLTAGLDDIPALPVTPEDATLLRQGRTLPGHPASHGLYLATDGPVPVALVDVSSAAVRVVRGFNLT